MKIFGALRLRALTARLWASSPLILVTEDGTLFEVIGTEVRQACDGDRRMGTAKPAGPPELILTIRETNRVAEPLTAQTIAFNPKDGEVPIDAIHVGA